MYHNRAKWKNVNILRTSEGRNSDRPLTETTKVRDLKSRRKFPKQTNLGQVDPRKSNEVHLTNTWINVDVLRESGNGRLD